jgi:hypothetical protein
MAITEESKLQQLIVRVDGSVEVCRCVTLTDADTGKTIACTNEYETFQAGTRMPDDVYQLLTTAASH